MLDTSTSRTISASRFLLSALVVVCHSFWLIPHRDYHYFWLDLISFSVPAFYIISGYLFFQKDEKYSETIKKKSYSILIPIFTWTLIHLSLYFIPKTLLCFMKGNYDLIANNKVTQFIMKSPFNAIRLFFLFSEDIANPYCGQFWYLRELFVLFILSPILKFMMKRHPKILLAFSILVYLSDIKYKAFSYHYGTCLLFFTLGGYIATKNFSAEHLKRIPFYIYATVTIILTSIILLLNVISTSEADLILFYVSKIWNLTISIAFFRICLFVSEKEGRFYEFQKYLAPFSFWVYAFHMPEPLALLSHNIQKLVKSEYNFLLATITAILLIGASTLSGILVRKTLPVVFQILNGGSRKH